MVRALTRRRLLLKFRRLQTASTLASLVTSMAMPITRRSEPFSSFAVAITLFWSRSMTSLPPPAHEGTRDLVANAVRRFRHDTVCGRRLGSARFYSRTFFGPSGLALAASTAGRIERVERQRGNRKAPRAPGTQHETDCLANREAGKAGEFLRFSWRGAR